MMQDVLEKVRRLIAQTKSDRVEEARTAALKACQLILEHELRVMLPLPAEASPPSPAPSAAKWSEKRAERERRQKADVIDIVSRAAGDVASSVVDSLIRKGGRR